MTPLHYYLISIATPLLIALSLLLIVAIIALIGCIKQHNHFRDLASEKERSATAYNRPYTAISDPDFITSTQYMTWVRRAGITAAVTIILLLLIPSSSTLLEMAKL